MPFRDKQNEFSIQITKVRGILESLVKATIDIGEFLSILSGNTAGTAVL